MIQNKVTPKIWNTASHQGREIATMNDLEVSKCIWPGCFGTDDDNLSDAYPLNIQGMIVIITVPVDDGAYNGTGASAGKLLAADLKVMWLSMTLYHFVDFVET